MQYHFWRLRTTLCVYRALSTPLLSPPTFSSSLCSSLPLTPSPLELSPFFQAFSPSEHFCSSQWKLCACVLRVLCVCFSKWSWSAAVHQWSWLQSGEYSHLTALLFNFQLLTGLFFPRLVELSFAPHWDSTAALVAPPGTIPLIEITDISFPTYSCRNSSKFWILFVTSFHFFGNVLFFSSSLWFYNFLNSDIWIPETW